MSPRNLPPKFFVGMATRRNFFPFFMVSNKAKFPAGVGDAGHSSSAVIVVPFSHSKNALIHLFSYTLWLFPHIFRYFSWFLVWDAVYEAPFEF